MHNTFILVHNAYTDRGERKSESKKRDKIDTREGVVLGERLTTPPDNRSSFMVE
jgi:hypothetical protein